MTRTPMQIMQALLQYATSIADGHRRAVVKGAEALTIIAILLPAIDEARLPDDECRRAIATVREQLPLAQADLREMTPLLDAQDRQLREMGVQLRKMKGQRL